MDMALYMMMGSAVFFTLTFIGLTAFMNYRGKERRERIKELMDKQIRHHPKVTHG